MVGQGRQNSVHHNSDAPPGRKTTYADWMGGGNKGVTSRIKADARHVGSQFLGQDTHSRDINRNARPLDLNAFMNSQTGFINTNNLAMATTAAGNSSHQHLMAQSMSTLNQSDILSQL